MERPAQNLHEEAPEAQGVQEAPAENALNLHGERDALKLHGKRDALNLHGKWDALSLHGVRDAQDLHVKRAAQKLHEDRRVPSVAPVPEDRAPTRNIFHTRCTVSGKVCGVIIDGSSYSNIASTYLVDKLNLPTLAHPTPYRLACLSDSDDIYVSRQVVVSFSIGRYEDQALCDVVPMQASHLLLGRPWQSEKDATHCGRTNHYSFMHGRKRIVLVPLSPSEVHELQVALARNQALVKTSPLIASSDSPIVPYDNSLPVTLMDCRDVLSTGRLFTRGPVEFTRPWGWRWLRDVFLGDIPTRLQPQRGIELQFEHVLGAQRLVHSLPLVQFKEEPPDFVRNTLTFNLPNSEIAGLRLILDIEVPDRLGVLNSGLDMSLLHMKLDIGSRAYPLVRVDSDTLLSALMLASSLHCLAGASREFQDYQWVKEKPPDLNLWVHGGREFRDDQWVKEKPPDLSLRLHGAERKRNYQVHGSWLRGKVDTTLFFTEFDLCFTFAGSVHVLRSKPLEEGGNDRSMDQQLVAEEQLEPEELGSQRIGGRLIMWVAWGMVAGLSTFAGKSVWTLSCQEDAELASPTLH